MRTTAQPSVAVLLSGGVDSSLALAMLAEERRYALRAYYIRIWLEDELSFLGECPWEEDLRFVKATAERFGVPLEVISLQRAYHERVVAHALEELRRGRTPSPDLLCNSQIKFGAFVDAVGDEVDLVATGHYARQRLRDDGTPELWLAPDPVKDQTYFLSRLSPAQLARALFPIGHLQKAEVRQRAAALGLPSMTRPDSQGICFLGQIPYPEFVRSHLGDAPGPIIDITNGRTLGEHRDLWFATIGQRKGLGLGGGPWYVVDKNPETRALLVVHADALGAHERADFEVEAVHWVSGEAPQLSRSQALGTWTTKLRHGPVRVPCVVTETATAGRLSVRLETPETGIAPGQFAVFYEGDRCLGSGVIA